MTRIESNEDDGRRTTLTPRVIYEQAWAFAVALGVGVTLAGVVLWTTGTGGAAATNSLRPLLSGVFLTWVAVGALCWLGAFLIWRLGGRPRIGTPDGVAERALQPYDAVIVYTACWSVLAAAAALGAFVIFGEGAWPALSGLVVVYWAGFVPLRPRAGRFGLGEAEEGVEAAPAD